jgi:hypothetical protein
VFEDKTLAEEANNAAIKVVGVKHTEIKDSKKVEHMEIQKVNV